MAFKQAERLPSDGPVSVTQSNVDGTVIVSVDDEHETGGFIKLSPYNASRVLSGLALLLGIRLNAQDAKGIKL